MTPANGSVALSMCLALLVCFFPSMLLGDEITLAADGKPAAVIVIPEAPTPVVARSADVLRGYIKKICGAALPIKRECDISRGDAVRVSIGATSLAAKNGFDIAGMTRGEFVCQIKNGTLFIFGKDGSYFNKLYAGGENGTWNGVCRFIEKCLNVRWLWPGAYGLVIPEQRSITVSIKGKFTEEPIIKSRGCRTPIYQSYWKKYWAEIGINSARYAELSHDLYDWQKFHLLGGSIHVAPGGHGFTKWWDEYGEKHPEWFAMQTDGTRKQNFDKWSLTKYTVKLCVSNQEVVDQIVENAAKHYAESDDVFMAAINDGGNAGFCICEKCLALDKPEKAPPRTLMYQSGPFDYCSLSDRYVDFWNRIAAKFEKRCPGRYFSVSAYGCITPPPVVNKIKSTAVLLSYVGFDYLNDKILADDRKWWKGWRSMMPEDGKMALRCNMLCEGYGLCYVYTTKMGRDFNQLFSKGRILAIDNDSLFNYWGTNGLNYYVLHKLMWNPSLDVEREVRDYCEKGFGKAASVVERYFKEVEKTTDEIASKNWNWKGGILKGLPTIYTPERLRELRGILEKAAEIAEGDSRKRVEFLMEGLEYTSVVSDILRERAAGTRGDAYKRALDAGRKFFKHQKFPFSAPYPADRYWRVGTTNDLRK